MKLVRFIEAKTGKYVCATQFEDGSLQLHTYMHRVMHESNTPPTMDIDVETVLRR